MFLGELEEQLGRGPAPAERLKAAGVFGHRHEVGPGLCMALIAVEDELEGDTPDGAPPG